MYTKYKYNRWNFRWKRRKLRSADVARYQLAPRQNLKLDSRLIRDINRPAFPPLAKIELRVRIEERGPLESEKGRGWGGHFRGISWKLVGTGWRSGGKKWKFHSRQQRTIRWKSNSTRYRATSSSSMSTLPLFFLLFRFSRDPSSDPNEKFLPRARLKNNSRIFRRTRIYPLRFLSLFYANFKTFTKRIN